MKWSLDSLDQHVYPDFLASVHKWRIHIFRYADGKIFYGMVLTLKQCDTDFAGLFLRKHCHYFYFQSSFQYVVGQIWS